MRKPAPHLLLPGIVLVGGAFCLVWFAVTWVTAALMFLSGWIDIFHSHWYETAIPLFSGLAVAICALRLLMRRVGRDPRQ